MSANSAGGPVSKVAAWIGRILSTLIVLAMGAGSAMGIFKHEEFARKMNKQYGYPGHVFLPLIFVELACIILYAIPRTAVLGAILLTGYLGGAVATHVRVDEKQWVIAVVLGALIWFALLLRDRRVRQLLPLRS